MSINPNGAPPGYYYQAGATAYTIDPAGTYSVGGATAPTTDPVGTYSRRGASAPTLAAAGTYIPVTGATSSAAEIVDPAGTYSHAGASAPITDPAGTFSRRGASAPTLDAAGTYSGAGASAPKLAAAGTHIPVTGATSSAAEVVDRAGTYSRAGASSATTDPAGTYSARRATAPTLAAAGTYIPGAGATSSAAEIVDPAGTYSQARASAATTDPAGTYSGAGASAPTPAAAGTYIPGAGATSSAAEIVDPAGTYSFVGASEATTDPAGTYSGPGASAPTPAAAGAYIPGAGATSSAAEIVDLAGTYSLAGASAATIDPEGTYSGAGAGAPTLAAAGTYIPVTGATSSAAEIVDGAGTYSLAGASTPTADPGGTYSAAGASAPTLDPAGTYSSPYALNCLFLETSSATPNNEVLSFNSVTAVANYYGDTSAEAGLAVQFFADYGTAANMLFIRFPVGGNRAHLYGANVSNLTLAQLQAINGTLSVTSQGRQYSATINLADVTSFTLAATAIQAALNENLPVAAVTTGDTITPESASFTGSANGLLLDVTSIASGAMEIGALISGAGVPAGTQINYQFTGTPGGVGLYSLYVPAGQISSEAMTESYGVLTVGSVSSGAVADGEQLTDTSGALLPDTAIEANLSGSGAGSTWVVNNSEAVSSEAMTMTGAPLSVLYTAIAGATQNSGYFSIQQNGDFNYASASLTYATGSTAAALGLAQGSGAWLQTPGGTITSEAAFMQMVEALDPNFGSFQATWPQLAEEDPASQTALEDWAQSTDGQIQFLENNTTNASPAGASAPTIDPAGTYSGPGASAPTLAAAGAYIPVTGATSSAAEIVDPAGSYSLAGASAYTLAQPGYYVATTGASSETPAAAGTYIPVTGATSATAEVADPAGSYCPAGASAPIIDPAGAYSGAGASAPTLAAAGTYIPVTEATSSAAEKVDPAGSYSLAGASAPTLAQPGYYVAAAGASSETPVSSGYYQPNSGATSEIPAQQPAISGTVAGQTTAPLETDAPFSSVTISDPNADASDSLSIALTGGGGVLSDGLGFDGLTTSGPGVYLLAGTAAAITSELRALIFTPSASTTPTTFTLTDTSTAGMSASNANTTVTVSTATPPVVSVETYLADKSTLDGDAGGFDILDTAGAITANLNQLDDTHINSINILDSGEVSPSVQQLTGDATAIGNLQNANASPVLLAVDDTAADIEAGLSTLIAQTSKIASITASGGPVVVSVATFLADQPTLDKIVGGFDVSDSAADIAQHFDALDADLDIASIALTDAGVPTLSISLAEAMNDTIALDDIATPHMIDIVDSAAETINSTEAIYLSGENIAVTGAPVIATGTVATMAIMGQIITSLLESQGYTLAVVDTAANIDGLSQVQINNLSLRGVLLLEASDTSVALTATAAVALEAADMTVTAPNGSEVTLTAPKTTVSNLTPATIAGLPALGVSGIVSTNGSVTISVAQALALEGADLAITVPSGGAVTLSDLASNIAALTPSQINGLPATGVSAIAVSNGANLALSAAQALALEAESLEVTPEAGYSVTVSDAAADVATLSAAQFAGLAAIGVSGISVSDNNNLTLSVAQTTALETSGVSLALQSGYSAFIADSAADIETLTAAQIAGLPALHVTQISATDTSVALTVGQSNALESAGMPVTAPAGDTVQVSDTAAHLQGLTASQIGGLAAIGATGLVSTNANVSYSSSQTAAILSSGLTVSAPAADTVTENFANGNYSVYQGGQLIQQQTVNADGSYDVAYFGVTGKAYSSYEDIYSSAGTLVADAQNNVNGAGTLLLYASGLTVTSSSGSDSVTTGSDTFAITPQSVETTNVQNSMSSETFVYGPGFGQDTLIGFLETGSAHDLLQFSASTYSFPSTQSQTADAQALLSNDASGTTNAVITDPQSDTLTVNNHAVSTFQNNLQDFKFT